MTASSSSGAADSILRRQSLVAPLFSWLSTDAKIRSNKGFSCIPRKNCRHFVQSTRIAIICVTPAVRNDSKSPITSLGESSSVPWRARNSATRSLRATYPSPPRTPQLTVKAGRPNARR